MGINRIRRKKYRKYYAEMKKNELVQLKTKSAMYDKGIPFNEAFKVLYKNRKETCRISKDINGDYELQIYCGDIWLPANKDKLPIQSVLSGKIRCFLDKKE